MSAAPETRRSTRSGGLKHPEVFEETRWTIAVAYSVDGVNYVLRRDLVSSLPAELPCVKLFYDPDNPEVATLEEPGLHGPWQPMLAMGVGLLIFALLPRRAFDAFDARFPGLARARRSNEN